ncbi:MAG TPA: sulfite exporter TauE/SafE family protein [Macromonas sp.]|nr:sulfite exporter TauE/SafE family protein [Macromonas sp.]
MIGLVLLAGLWAGLQNALAGGGSFVTLPALMLTGMSPLAANITSTVALFPGQVTSGWAGRRLVSGVGTLPFKALFAVSIVGGVLGALLLLNTPSSVFSALVPWLVLFATTVFAWGSFFRRTGGAGHHVGPKVALLLQFLISVYGGYFGGGIGILMLAALTLAGMATRNAGATKNVLAGVMNASAVALFVTSPQVHWLQAVVLGGGAIAGGLLGAWALHRVNEKALRVAVVAIGLSLSVGLFLRPLGG